MLKNGTRIGLLPPQAELDAEDRAPRWRDILAFAHLADEAGFDSVDRLETFALVLEALNA